MKSIRRFLRRGETHALLGVLFGIVFTWPFIAIDRPASVFKFLYVAWFVAILLLFVLSRLSDEDEVVASEGPTEDDADGDDHV